MFHFADPEEAGFGVMILIPGFTRSSQPWMFFGLPLRTTMATTDWVRMPLVGVLFQSAETCLLSTSRCTSGSSERGTTSAFCPPSTARLWSPDAPYDCWKVTPLPSLVLLKSAMTFLFACSRIEKPTTLTAFWLLLASDAPEEPPQAARVREPTATQLIAAAAVFHLKLMSDSFRVIGRHHGVRLSHVDYSI